MKKYLSFLLALFIIFSLSACESETPKETVSKNEVVEVVETPTPTSTPTQTHTPTPTPISLKDLKVHFLDVGQADSIFVELPNNESMLIDAGKNGSGSTVVSYIKGLGFTTIDYLIGTHPHEDHIGGLDDVINSLKINNIYMPKVSHTSKTFEDVLTAIKNNNLTVKTSKAGVSILDLEDLKVNIIAPISGSYKDLNDYSTVIKLTYKNNSFLLAGDAESVSENEMINSGEDLKADLLKVGHHGSSSSTTRSFLNKVNPKYSVISVGKGNSYGHPSSQTLATLNEYNVEIYRTDEAGTIIATSDGNNITLNKNKSTIKANAPPPAAKSTESSSTNTQVQEQNNVETTVYITNSGKKYHSSGCQYLSKSKISIDLNKAKNQGYTACSKCSPPR